VKNWRLERRRDHYYKLAKREGYLSRAAYKLLEINRKYRLFRPSMKIVDLGCAPGGWLQVASKTLGSNGKILGIDIVPIKPVKAGNVSFIRMDLRDENLSKIVLETMNGSVDGIISDASPKISGVWEVDHARQIELAEAALKLARETLKPGGFLLVKLFDGPMLKNFREEVKKSFSFVRLFKPKASRTQSSELYLVALNFKGSA
jgi:23S rRNA (uridine2552-2'-O)-methyltransferase